jgi:alanine dehydrogenase
MDIGIPVERAAAERRVAQSPAGVERLVQAGHRVWVERSAGAASRFTDEEYLAAGARLSSDAEEVYGRAELLLKVLTPQPWEYELLREDGILMCFFTPGVAPTAGARRLIDRRVATVAMEMIEDPSGNVPVLRAMSEIAGPMAIQVAAHLLESASGGRGILLGGAPGIPPATVVILGAGVVGTGAATTALGNGAHVVLLDRDVERLRSAERVLGRPLVTMLADDHHLPRVLRFADALIGAVMIRGDDTPRVVTESMVRQMKPGAVIVDVSIDQGGCAETSRPTSILEPVYTWGGVIHYAVPNMPANVARTATRALTHASLPYVLQLARLGAAGACAQNPGLSRGLVTAGGRCLDPFVARRLEQPAGDGLGAVAAPARRS